MHDDLLERRLRSALHDEGDRLSITITADELERRLALRRRRSAPSRLTLLLAAAVAIGGIGGMAIIAGLSNRPAPPPVANATHTPAPPTPAASGGPLALPSLDELLAGVEPATIALAGTHDMLDTHETSDIPIPEPNIRLGNIPGGTTYELRAACAGDGSLVLDIRLPGQRGPAGSTGPTIACDGQTFSQPLRPQGDESVSFSASFTGSWRVAVVRTGEPVTTSPSQEPPMLTPQDGYETLIDLQPTVVEPAPSLDSHGRALRPLGAVSSRWSYLVDAWCQGTDAIRYIHGGDVAGTFGEATSIEIPCDGGAHQFELGFPEISGTEAFIAAAPGAQVAVLVSSEAPPLAALAPLPGWQNVMSAGPDLVFQEQGVSISSGGVEGGGQLLVVVDCAAPAQTLEVRFDGKGILGDAFETFPASCSPEGARTTHTFMTKGDGFLAETTFPAGSWLKLSAMIPEGSLQH